jgi:cytochrome c556
LRLGSALVGAALAIMATVAIAYAGAPAQVVADRIKHYKDTGQSLKAIVEQLKSPSPDLAVMRSAMPRIVTTARDQYGWFPQGSGPAPGIITKAKPEIWTDPQGFRAAQDRFKRQADVMNAAIARGDLAATKAALLPLGMACGGCHHAYREKEED